MDVGTMKELKKVINSLEVTEPVFLVRGGHILAPKILRFAADLLRHRLQIKAVLANQNDHPAVVELRQYAQVIEKWQKENPDCCFDVPLPTRKGKRTRDK